VEIAMKLNLDQATTPIRGTVSLPHGTGKKTCIAVFCKGDFQNQAKEVVSCRSKILNDGMDGKKNSHHCESESYLRLCEISHYLST